MVDNEATPDCDCIDCEFEREFESSRFYVEPLLCAPHGEPECPLCTVDCYDC